jgi:hypothetical protein
MEAVKVIGFEIAKSVFQVHGINADWPKAPQTCVVT